jgi:uncharacterized Fe-S center protein
MAERGFVAIAFDESFNGESGGKPFLTDCNTMYPGSRKNALEHLVITGILDGKNVI